MLNDLSPQQRELENYMSELSEHAYSAGWRDGLEFALWKLVIDGPYKYGQYNLNNEHRNSLVKLSGACDGWIIFHDQFEETFVPMNQWLEIFKAAAR
jgi:hypothetical protein